MLNYNSPTYLSLLLIMVSDLYTCSLKICLIVFDDVLKRLNIFVFRNGGRNMNAFDKVIGYESIKKELLRIYNYEKT